MRMGEAEEDQPTTLAKVKQMTLTESRDRMQVWDLIHQRIGGMIVIDCKPFLIV